MASRRSILDRQDLYCPAPVISGRASYGGVPKDIYFFVPMSFFTSFLLSIGVAWVLWMMTGETYVRLLIFTPFIVTFIFYRWMMRRIRKRRDFFNVLKETRKFEV